MHAIANSIIFLLLILSSRNTNSTITNQTQPPYKPTECFLLNCGSSSNHTTDYEGRLWEGDSDSKYFSLPSKQRLSSELSTASEQDLSVPQVPYQTARIFHSKFTYSLPSSPGQKFVRLHFYSATYSGLDKSDSFFSVTANSFTLLSNFSASHVALATSVPYFVKEFIINVANNQNLINLTFNPSPRSYAFINGIEVVSMPDNLYLPSTDKPITFVGSNVTPFFFTNDTALEKVYRLNVGGKDVFSINDTGMFRTWIQDWPYVYSYASGTQSYMPNVTIEYNNKTPAYTAPDVVYSTFRTMSNDSNNNTKFNLTWLLPVDSGFLYLVRLHFCNVFKELTLQNQVVFHIYINNMTAEEQMDVVTISDGARIPMYRDYVTFVARSQSHGPKEYLRLDLNPNQQSRPQYYYAFLNGAEIFKLSRADGLLAGPNPEVGQPPAPLTRTQPKLAQLGTPANKGIRIAGAVLGFLLGLSLVCLLIFCRRRIVPKQLSNNAKASSLPSELCRHFRISEIRAATRNFDGQCIIGGGGFGDVYKGYIDGGETIVAIKRLKPRSSQGANEFKTEIELLSHLRHLNLVSLIGYCDNDGEMILVYDYMARGTLSNHLYNTDNPPLSWKQRLQICIGTASGLDYLHTGAKYMIIHRDVKTTNILLNEKWVAKVSDFGLSRTGPSTLSKTHVSTLVKGSFGYLDPEYYRRQQLTEKSDVYSFGVVLCEVLCGRPALMRTVEKKQMNLAEWVKSCYQEGTLNQIVDPYLTATITPECLKKYGEIMISCLHDNGVERPSMKEVLRGLQFVMQLQVKAEEHIKLGGEPPEVDIHGEIRYPCSWEDPSGAVFSDINGLEGR